jgi:signal transduction histidine kinase
VTHQLALERQLRQAQKLESIGQLAAGIAHEINTPMQYIGDNTRFLDESFAEMIELNRKYGEAFEAAKRGDMTEKLLSEVDKAAEEADVAYLSEEIGKAIEQSLDGIQRVTAIVRAMKDFSHMGQDERVGMDINRAIESTVTVARHEWKYVADLVTDFDPSLPSVLCYPGEFNQMILNLITNAAHAIGKKVGDRTGEKGRITVSTKLDGEWVEVRVSDTGTGIPEEIRERIFDPFFTTKEVGKGTGQGLSIAHSVVVDKHGGSICFETETGVGTTFTVRLPTDPGRTKKESGKEDCPVAVTGG